MKEIFLYPCIAEFKRQFYKNLLTSEHLVGGELKIDKVSYEDGAEDDLFNFWGWELRKDGVKYLLSCRDSNDIELNLKQLLPIVASNTQKVAHRGVVYRQIHKPIPARFKAIKTQEFQEFVDGFTSFDHSHPDHQLLDTFMAIASAMDRVYFRKSTPPGFGKDSIVDIFGGLFGGCATIENPTVAKLEERASVLKWLAVNEIVEIQKGDWRKIEQILLAMGAYKPEVTKRSRAHGNVGEVIDISDFSLSLMFNDIDNYPDPKKYMDNVSKDAVLDRFVPLRLYGTITEDFNSYSALDIPKYVKRNIEQYKNVIYNFTYYKKNLLSLLHGYNREGLIPLPSRWSTNIGKLLNVIDVYCNTQEEFSEWIHIINTSIIDYKEMLKFPDLHKELCDKLDKEYPKAEEFRVQVEALNKELSGINTFIDKNTYVKTYEVKKKKEISLKNKDVTDFWNKENG